MSKWNLLKQALYWRSQFYFQLSMLVVILLAIIGSMIFLKQYASRFDMLTLKSIADMMGSNISHATTESLQKYFDEVVGGGAASSLLLIDQKGQIVLGSGNNIANLIDLSKSKSISYPTTGEEDTVSWGAISVQDMNGIRQGTLFIIFNHTWLTYLIKLICVVFTSVALGLVLLQMIFHRYTVKKRLAPIESLVQIGDLATKVSHDIRSPLSSLKAAVGLLKGELKGSSSGQEALNLLQLSGNRLENIANDLLAKHKGDSGSQKTFSIHEVLDELIGEMQASPLGSGAQFKKSYSSSAIYIHGDKTGLTRAIGNIVKNALEAMQGNPVERVRGLTVTTAVIASDRRERGDPATGIASPAARNDSVFIRITDTGPGIPAEKIPLILQGGHTEGKADGHGIGTKVVREMVEAHQGQLGIESEVGVGTTFSITLPLAPPLAGGVAESTVTIPYSNTITVIDDEPSLREQWRLILKSKGIEARCYESWEAYASAVPPHPGPLPQGEGITFIIDYHFDNSLVDGLEIMRRLKAMGHNQLVLATAEYWKPDIKEAAKELNLILCPKPLPTIVIANPDAVVASDVHTVIANPAGVTQSSEPNGIAMPQNDNSLPHPPQSGDLPLQRGGKTVLLIDDAEEIRASWIALKRILGISTLHAHPNLESVIEANITLGDCDLCVIDKNIEESAYTGAKTLAYLKQNGAKKVILATGETGDPTEDPDFAQIDGVLEDKVPTSLNGIL